MQIRIAKSQREDKTAYVAVRAGEMTGFAAVRYDHARRAHRAPTAAAHLTDTEKGSDGGRSLSAAVYKA